MALLEAMAAGLPSITTAVGGIGDLVEHDVSGILVEPGDVEELASAIEKLASEEDLRRSLGDTGAGADPRRCRRRGDRSALARAVLEIPHYVRTV